MSHSIFNQKIKLDFMELW